MSLNDIGGWAGFGVAMFCLLGPTLLAKWPSLPGHKRRQKKKMPPQPVWRGTIHDEPPWKRG